MPISQQMIGISPVPRRIEPDGFATKASGLPVVARPDVGLQERVGIAQDLDIHPPEPQGLGKVVVSGVWLGVMGAWSLWILG